MVSIQSGEIDFGQTGSVGGQLREKYFKESYFPKNAPTW